MGRFVGVLLGIERGSMALVAGSYHDGGFGVAHAPQSQQNRPR
jgi:hypothetical protein